MTQKPTTKPAKVVRSDYMNIRVTPELAESLKKIAFDEGRTLAGQVFHVLNQFIKAYKA